MEVRETGKFSVFPDSYVVRGPICFHRFCLGNLMPWSCRREEKEGMDQSEKNVWSCMAVTRAKGVEANRWPGNELP